MRISDWSSDVCSSDLPSDAQRKCDPIRPSLLANLFWRANQSAPSPGPSMFTRPLSIAALSQTAPYDTFLFRSAARPVLMADTAFVRARIDETLKDEAAAVLDELGLTGSDRKSVVKGKGVSVRVDLGGRRNIKTNNN